MFVLDRIKEAASFEDGGILVARQTDPDWVPVMKHAAAIVTDTGWRTSHAAIVSRELETAAIVGAGNATSVLGGHTITASGADGQTGRVYDGVLPFLKEHVDYSRLP